MIPSACDATAASAEDALAAPLPAGWTEHLHPETGLVYFLDTGAADKRGGGELSWQHPAEAHFLEMAPWVGMVSKRLERLLEIDQHEVGLRRPG